MVRFKTALHFELIFTLWIVCNLLVKNQPPPLRANDFFLILTTYLYMYSVYASKCILHTNFNKQKNFWLQGCACDKCYCTATLSTQMPAWCNTGVLLHCTLLACTCSRQTRWFTYLNVSWRKWQLHVNNSTKVRYRSHVGIKVSFLKCE